MAAIVETIEKERRLEKQQVSVAFIKEGFQPEKIVKCTKNLTLEDVIKYQKKLINNKAH